jgi:lipopolysaccharide exporter
MDLDVHGRREEDMSTLKTKAVSGIKWTTVSQLSRLGTQLLTTIILARLLLPSDFGLISMAMAVIGFINIFKDLGTSAAVIQKKDLTEVLLPSLFWVNVCFGTLASLVLFLSAPLIGMFYHEPRVVEVLRVLAPSFFISGLGIVHQALLERSLSFDSLAKLEVTSNVTGAVIGIGMAFLGFGVWSLVFQSLATIILGTLLLWMVNPWRPRGSFHWKEVQAVSGFSLNLTGFGILNYLARNADYLLIGRYLGAQELGYYTLAYRILLFPIQNISSVISRVIYPVLSTFQDDNNRFSTIYLKVTSSIALISFPLMLGVLALARPFVLTFFGEKWEPVIQLVIILAPVGLIQSIGTTVGMIYQAKGRTDWMFRWGLGAGISVILAFIVGLQWGVTGVAGAYAIVSFVLAYPSFYIPFQLIDLKFLDLVKVLRPAFLNSLLMFIVLILMRLSLPKSWSNAVILSLSVIAGSTVYAVASYLTNQEQIRELLDLLGLRRTKVNETG